MIRYYLPLFVFIAISVALLAGLSLEPSRIPSPYINKPAPNFQLNRLDAPTEQKSTADFLGRVWLLNVWASWCVACLQEHPILNRFLKDKVTLIGLNYKDDRQDAQQWLAKWGNPYLLSLSDKSGKTGLDWGVYGVPETFVIDKQGIIRYKYIGPLGRQDIKEIILPLVRTLQAE